jgi:hypothetical protein
MKQLVICRSCHGHGRIYPRAGGQPIRCPDGRQLIVACTDCHATGLVPMPALEMVVTEAGTYVLAPGGADHA